MFLSEDDRVGHRAAHEFLLEEARTQGVAGGTVWRGIEGFGSSGRLRTTRLPDVAEGLPVAFEIIDEPEKVDAFVSTVVAVAPRALIVRDEVGVLLGDGRE